MAAEKIEIVAERLAAGSDLCDYAADGARRAAEALGTASLTSGMFGDFDEARQFHTKLAAAHESHQRRLHDHHATVRGISGKAMEAAGAFTGTDETTADAINSAAGAFD
jgi:aldehyde:ferredoxin oxidoreductase